MKYNGRRVQFGEKVWVTHLPTGGIPFDEFVEMAQRGVPFEDLQKSRKPVPLRWFQATYIGMCQYGKKFKRYMKAKSDRQPSPVLPAIQTEDGKKSFVIGCWCIPDKEVQKGLVLPPEFSFAD